MGYIGPVVVNQLRSSFPDAFLVGYDMGYFASSLTNSSFLPENQLDMQIFGDVRNIPVSVFNDIDAVIYLAAISNDAMGHSFEEVTLDVNYKSAIKVAKSAKDAGAKSFIFASSCSIYGAANDKARTEESDVNPLTAYAKSKVYAERDLEPLADENFTVTCLRFATACGMSPRLRLDLVLNDFVAGAVSSGKVNILSDGSPWRPVIHVKDMARAIKWAVERNANNGGTFLTVNAGSNKWNYQVLDLAQAVSKVISGVRISTNKDAVPDRRSYRVNFELFEKLAPNDQPICNLTDTIQELYDGLISMSFDNIDFRNSNFMRLGLLNSLREKNHLNEELSWVFKPSQKESIIY